VPGVVVLIVLDASALVSLLNKEPGWEVLAGHAVNQDATISAVNYSEVLQRPRLGVAAEDIDAQLDRLAITISAFSRLDARLAASFYRHRSGLSLADRVCLALARSISSPVCTADHLWQRWADDLGVEVVLIRRPRRSPAGTAGAGTRPVRRDATNDVLPAPCPHRTTRIIPAPAPAAGRADRRLGRRSAASCAGARRSGSAGLYDLLEEALTVDSPNAAAKTTCVVGGMLADADSIDDLETRVEVNRGGPGSPLSEEELARKFHDNAVRSLPEERAAGIAARTLAFSDAQSVEDLTALLTSAGER